MNTKRASSCRFCAEGAEVSIDLLPQLIVLAELDGRPIRERICRWTHDAPHLCDTCPLYEAKP